MSAGTIDITPATPAVPTRLARLLKWICWLYLAFATCIWLVFRFGGDTYWLPTVLLFGPRYVYGLPLYLLIPAAFFIRRRSLIPLGISIIPNLIVMGLSLGLGRFHATMPGPHLRILTANIDGRHVDNIALGDLIRTEHPDIVALQEFEVVPGAPELIWPVEYHRLYSHSLVLASVYPIREVGSLDEFQLHGPGAIVQFEIQMPTGKITFFNMHLATPREGLDPLMHEGTGGIDAMKHSIMSRWRESHLATEFIRPATGPLLLSGDMNTPSDSAIFRTYWSGYQDAHTEVGFGLGYSKFTRFWGVRIDHILAADGWRFLDCHIGEDVGSDHRPVIADVQWVGDPNAISLSATQPSQ